MSDLTQSLTTILLAIVGVGLVAVLVSRNANTSGVIQSASSGFSNSLAVAQSPVTGNSVSINTSYPSDSMGLAGISNSFPAGF